MFVCVKVRALRLNFLTSFTFLIGLLERVAESGTRVWWNATVLEKWLYCYCSRKETKRGGKVLALQSFCFCSISLFSLIYLPFEVSFSVSLGQTTFNAFFVAVIYVPKYSMSELFLLALILSLVCFSLSGQPRSRGKSGYKTCTKSRSHVVGLEEEKP